MAGRSVGGSDIGSRIGLPVAGSSTVIVAPSQQPVTIKNLLSGEKLTLQRVGVRPGGQDDPPGYGLLHSSLNDTVLKAVSPAECARTTIFPSGENANLEIQHSARNASLLTAQSQKWTVPSFGGFGT